jgi:hypothetical protein
MLSRLERKRRSGSADRFTARLRGLLLKARASTSAVGCSCETASGAIDATLGSFPPDTGRAYLRSVAGSNVSVRSGTLAGSLAMHRVAMADGEIEDFTRKCLDDELDYISNADHENGPVLVVDHGNVPKASN